jgi:UDP-N-acetylglucosamine 2-epimerase (non-hydrolysing)
VQEESISVTGNTVIDALHMSTAWSVKHDDPRVQALVDSGEKFVLITSHRRENLEHGIHEIRSAIQELSNKYPKVTFVFPMHKNPAVRKPLQTLEDVTNVILCEPLPYAEFVNLMKKSYLILTDSGGVQEEAPTFGIPVLVMRDTTERPEAIQAGVAALVGASSKSIVSKTVELMESSDVYASMAKSANPYGDGLASARIVARIEEFLSSRAT